MSQSVELDVFDNGRQKKQKGIIKCKFQQEVSIRNIKEKEKKNAFRLSMMGLAQTYVDLPPDAQMYQRYNTLKRLLFLQYTILPQILIGAIIGITTSVITTYITTEVYKPAISIWEIIGIVVFAVGYSYVLCQFIFSSQIQALMEYAIRLIEEKMKVK